MYCILSNLIANNRAVQRAVENEVNTQYMTPTCICKSVISYFVHQDVCGYNRQ